MTEFQDYFGEHTSLILDKTFRFNNQICDFSTQFIEKNPKQIRKKLLTNAKVDSPQITLVPTSDYETTIKQLSQKTSLNNETTFILGRYRHNKPKHLPRSTRYLTAHKSKGTEADHVIITNLESGKLGFPCNISDDPLLSLVLAKEETYPYAEERRLFYVAVTRAKKHVYLLYDPDNYSPFIKEIQDEHYPVISQTSDRKSIGVCPRCNGEIILVNGRYSDFLACSNYPYCDYKTPSCPVCIEGNLILNGEYFVCDNCGNRTRKCPDCLEGYEVLRKGYSKFWGCSNFPDCQHTRKISLSLGV
jgi:DNA helicase-4